MIDHQNSTYLNYSEGLSKAQSFCALQDRAESQVLKKLKDWRVDPSHHLPIIDRLYEQKFLDQSRFADSYVRGKFNQKRWGRIKISAGLRNLEVPSYLIKEAIAKIPSKKYEEALEALYHQKARNLPVEDFKTRQKVMRYLAQKGFEPSAIIAVCEKNS